MIPMCSLLFKFTKIVIKQALTNFIKIDIARFAKHHQFGNKYKNFNKSLPLKIFIN